MFILQCLILDAIFIVNLHVLILIPLLLLSFLLQINIVPALLCSHEVNHIYVGTVDVLEDALVGVHTDAHRFVDADGFHSITWFDPVD